MLVPVVVLIAMEKTLAVVQEALGVAERKDILQVVMVAQMEVIPVAAEEMVAMDLVVVASVMVPAAAAAVIPAVALVVPAVEVAVAEASFILWMLVIQKMQEVLLEALMMAFADSN